MINVVKTHSAAGMVPYCLYQPSADWPIIDGNVKFLLLKNSLGWEFPKGHIEEGETELEAAEREVKEETGLTHFRVHPRFKYVSKYFLTKNYETGEKLETPEPKTVTYFLAEILEGKEVNLSFEHDSYGWFTPDQANKKLYFGKKQEVLQRAKRFIKA